MLIILTCLSISEVLWYTVIMKYIIKNQGIKVKVEKQWLKRNGYSKDTIKVFGSLAKDIEDPTDEFMFTMLKMNRTRYENAKKALVYCGLLEVHRINGNVIVYLVGSEEIVKFARLNEKKELDRLNRLTLDSLGLSGSVEVDYIDTIYSNK